MKLAPLACSLALVAGPAALLAGDSHRSEPAVTTIAAGSQEAENAMKTFTFDPGLRVSLWAAEPMVANPVSFSQDEKGRWYVAETFRAERGVEDDRNFKEWQDEDIASKSTEDRLAMFHRHFPDAAKFKERFETAAERICRLEDSTGSGHADKMTVFAEGFRDALDGTGAGIVARGREVWWTCIPNLWHFADRDDDGVAEVKEKLLSGFGVHVALHGHDLHGLRFGPDGKLYFSLGDRALHVRTKEGADVAQTESGSILRCNPDGTGFEIFATGVRNPQELAFDEHGNLFTCDNNSDAGDKCRFTYLVEGADCGWRMAFQYLPDRGPWMRERPWDEKIAPTVRYIVPCVANIANGPSGITYNPGTGLSAKYERKFFLSDFRGGATASVVHEITTEPRGAFFTAKARDWLKGMLSTDVEFGNDGSLYTLDWVASWGGCGKGRIYRFTDPQADTARQKETATLIRDGMEKRAEAELAKLLGHADQRVRQAAQFELARRGAKAVPIFTAIAASPKVANPLARLHAIWGLGQLGRVETLPALLGDADPEVRAQAAKVLGDAKSGAERLVAALSDRENRVRFFAAIGLGRIGYKPAFEPLCALLAENDDRDPILRHGGVFGLAGCASAEQIASKLHAPSAALRGAAVVALRRLQSPLVAAFLKDADESVVVEAARAIHDVPIEPALPALAALAADHRVKNPFALSRAVNAHFRLGKAENAVALAKFAADSAEPEAARRDALDALGDWAHPDPKDRLLNQWRPLPPRSAQDAASAVTPQLAVLFHAPAGVQEATAGLAKTLRITSAGPPLSALATDTTAGAGARVAAIDALASLGDPRLAEVARHVATDANEKVRNASVKALAGAKPEESLKVIAQLVDTAPPRERQAAVAALAQVKSPAAAAIAGRLLDSLIAGTLLPEIQIEVLETANQLNTPALQDKLARYDQLVAKGDALAKYRVALRGGDVDRGRKIFREKAETQCLRCHKNEIGDSVVGPELTHIGATKDRDYLLESIILPNKRIAEGFETVVLTLKDGNVVAGRLVAQDAATLTVETPDASGKPQRQTVPLAQVRQRDRAPSPMPPMGELLSRAELRDLVEFLATRK